MHSKTYHGDLLVSRSVSASEQSCALDCGGKNKLFELKSCNKIAPRLILTHYSNHFKPNSILIKIYACLDTHSYSLLSPNSSVA